MKNALFENAAVAVAVFNETHAQIVDSSILNNMTLKLIDINEMRTDNKAEIIIHIRMNI